MVVISNSTPLIYLAKIGKLHLLRDLFGNVIIPEDVYREVVINGLKHGYSDAQKVKKAIEGHWISIVKAKKKQKISFSDITIFSKELDIGELTVLALAREYNNPLLLIDDKVARKVAEFLGYRVVGTIYIILLSFKKKLITKREALVCVDKLISSGFRISAELYKRLISYLSSLDEK